MTHPAFIGFLTICQIEQSYDYSTLPATLWTDAVSMDTGNRLKIIDERDVRLLQKLP